MRQQHAHGQLVFPGTNGVWRSSRDMKGEDGEDVRPLILAD
jgi:hypothetical protein